jgi:hypothetical protein
MNFLTHRSSLVTDSHVNVTGLFRDTVAATLCTRGEALQDRALFDVNGLYEQFVDVGTVVVLGVRNRGLQNLLDDERAFFRAELQDVQRGVNLLAADLFDPTGARL